jgi:hypothetical protein
MRICLDSIQKLVWSFIKIQRRYKPKEYMGECFIFWNKSVTFGPSSIAVKGKCFLSTYRFPLGSKQVCREWVLEALSPVDKASSYVLMVCLLLKQRNFIFYIYKYEKESLLNIHLNMIFLILLTSSEEYLSYMFFCKYFVYISQSSDACYEQSLSHSPWFDDPNDVSWRAQIVDYI